MPSFKALFSTFLHLRNLKASSRFAFYILLCINSVYYTSILICPEGAFFICIPSHFLRIIYSSVPISMSDSIFRINPLGNSLPGYCHKGEARQSRFAFVTMFAESQPRRGPILLNELELL